MYRNHQEEIDAMTKFTAASPFVIIALTKDECESTVAGLETVLLMLDNYKQGKSSIKMDMRAVVAKIKGELRAKEEE